MLVAGWIALRCIRLFDTTIGFGCCCYCRCVATLLVVVPLVIASAVSMLVRDCKHIVGLLVLLLAGWLSGFVHLFSSEYFAVMLRRSLRS